MKVKNFFILIIISVTSIFLFDCNQKPVNTPLELSKATNAELKQNLELWRKRNISRYSFEISKIHMGTWSILPSFIEVKNNKVVSKKPIGEMREMTRVEDFEDFETIEKSFSTIQNAYDKDFVVEVTYNKEFGYPEKITIDSMEHNHSNYTVEIHKFNVIE